MRQTITLYNRSGFDRYGKEVVGSGTTVKARVQPTSKVRFQYGAEGSQQTQYVITAIIYLPPGTTVNEGDKITYNSLDYRVHGKSEGINGVGGANHIKVECTKWQMS